MNGKIIVCFDDQFQAETYEELLQVKSYQIFKDKWGSENWEELTDDMIEKYKFYSAFYRIQESNQTNSFDSLNRGSKVKTKNEYIKEKKYFPHDEIANKILQDNNIVYVKNKKQIALYYQERYILETEQEKHCLTLIIPNYVTGHTMKDEKEIIYYLETTLQKEIKKVEEDENYILTPKGILDLEKCEVIERNPNLYVFREINTDYNPNIKEEWPAYQEFDKMLGEIFEEDQSRQELFFECLGVSLKPSHQRREAFFLYGTGSNGKSELMKLFRNTLGIQNVSSATLQDLNVKFGLSNLIDKIVNISAENPRRNSKSIINILKILTGGDLIEVEKKFKNRESKPYTGRLWISSNYLLNSDDVSKALLDRLIFIPFDHTFENNSRWIGRSKMLADPKSREYFFYLMIQGVKQYRENGNRFTTCERSEQLKEKMKRENNIVYQYLREIWEEKKIFIGAKLRELYSNFQIYCKEKLGLQNYEIMKLSEFKQNLEDLGIEPSKPIYNQTAMKTERRVNIKDKKIFVKYFSREEE